MITQFRTLFTVTVAHAYYRGNCKDIHFIIPSDMAQALKNGKLLAKELDGALHVLFEADEPGAALLSMPEKTLRIGLQLVNPFFSNFTDVDASFASSELLYRNATTPTALDAAKKVTMVGQVFSHSLTDSARPVTVTLKDSAGQSVRSDVITAAENRASVSYDLTGQTPGACTIQEAYPTSTKQLAYYCDAELTHAGVFGILEIRVGSKFYTTSANFRLTFAARNETLNYYVVVTTKQASDLDPLSVTDAGFTEDKRAQIQFSKVPSASFTAAELPPNLLGDSSKQVVLFRSQAVVPRAEKARKRIQLMKNGAILISHLPQPGPDKNTATLIVSVSKL